MTGTIRFSGRFQVENGVLDSGVEQFDGEITQNNVGGGNPGTVTATTGGGITLTPGLSTLGWASLRNLDGTNFVDVGPNVAGTTHPFLRLKPNEPAQRIRLTPGITIGAIADTASCKISVEIWED